MISFNPLRKSRNFLTGFRIFPVQALTAFNIMTFRLFVFCSFFWCLGCVCGYGQFFRPVPLDKTSYERLILAKEKFQKAIEAGREPDIANAAYVLGKRYAEVNDSTAAFSLFNKAQTFNLKTKEFFELVKIHIRMGEWYMHHEYFEKAYEHFTLAKKYSGLSGNSDRLADINLCLSIVHEGAFRQGLNPKYVLDSVFYYAEASLQAGRSLENKKGLEHLLLLAGEMYTRNGKQSLALTRLEEGYNISTSLGDTSFIIRFCTSLAGVYFLLGKYHHAELKAKYADRLAEIFPKRDPVYDIFRQGLLADISARLGRWQQSQLYRSNQLRLSQLQADGYQAQLSEGARLLHQSEQEAAKLGIKKKHLELLVAEKSRRQFQVISVGASILILIIATLAIVYFRLFNKYRILSIENERLVREQSHRIKNNLQSLIDLILLQINGVSDPAAIRILQASLTRIDSMLMVHRRLYGRKQISAIAMESLIPDLVDNVLNSYQLVDLYPAYDLDRISIEPDQAITIALILNELATNSCKYGLPAALNPELHVSCKLKGGQLYLSFRDNGPGFHYERNTETFGLQLIGMLAHKLEAKFRFSSTEGCHFELTMAYQGISLYDKFNRDAGFAKSSWKSPILPKVPFWRYQGY